MKDGYYGLLTMCYVASSQVGESSIDDRITRPCVIYVSGLTNACGFDIFCGRYVQGQ